MGQDKYLVPRNVFLVKKISNCTKREVKYVNQVIYYGTEVL